MSDDQISYLNQKKKRIKKKNKKEIHGKKMK